MKTQLIVCATIFIAAAQLSPPAAAVPIPGPGSIGLQVTPTEQAVRLPCAFQRLDGLATREGLWLNSTVLDHPNDRFRVKAVAVGRKGRPSGLLPYVFSVARASSPASRVGVSPPANLLLGGTPQQLAGEDARATSLSPMGKVSVEGQTVRFTRPALVEEYTVSLDGVRQDFLVLEKPDGVPASHVPLTPGEMRVELAVTGARVEQTAYGAQLILEPSGRKIAYSQLKATDANGKKLPAGIEVADKSEIRDLKSAMGLAVVVDDSNAVYPVRIDPTFSDANWISMGGIPGANGYISAAVVDGEGNLYIGGQFSQVGDVVANGIAKWNGSAWSALGVGMGNYNFNPPAVYALAVSGSNVYAGGYFMKAGGSPATNVAKWDGSAWSPLGLGIGFGGLYYPATVSALAVLGTDVYAGGDFTNAGGIPANYIAKWDGNSWSALGSGVGGGIQYPPIGVTALAVLGGNVYVAGNFTSAGGITASNIAKWDGAAWSVLGSGMDSLVNALAVSGNDLYAGGSFGTAGGIAAIYIAKWDGSAWSALGPGPGYPVSALAVSGSDVYAGWTTNPICAGGGCAGGGAGVLRWNSSSWSALGSGMGAELGPRVNALAVLGGKLFAGGFFTFASGNPANYIAQWDGSAWGAVGSGIAGGGGMYPLVPIVNAVTISGTNVYVGGNFITAGAAVATNIATWNGSAWIPLGSGVATSDGSSPVVYALAPAGNNTYAGGNFTTAGGAAVNYIAKWDGSGWSALGLGMNSTVFALALSGSDLYAAGSFTIAGGSAANYIAKWNGSNWVPLGSGLNGPVDALAISGSTVYAGGSFTAAGGSAATNIAKWDGSTWSALGSGMDYQVLALAVSGNDLYAGGYFDYAGGSRVNYIAKWNGSAWSALGSGVDYYVSALAVSGSDLYAGGNIYTAGGNPVRGIAKWDGSAWSPLGSGVNGIVQALALSGSDLYVGGTFTTAGGKVSAYVAKAIIGPPPFYLVTTNGGLGLNNNGQFYFTLVGPAGSNAVVFASTNLQTWTPLVTNPLTGGSLSFTDSLTTNFTRRFYRGLLQP